MRIDDVDGAAHLSSDLIALAYGAAPEARQWPDVMAGLQAIVNCRAALVISYDFRRKSGHICYAAGIPSTFLESYERLAPLDPWLACEETPFKLETPYIGEIPDADPRNFDVRFLRKWLEPQKLYHCMRATLATVGDVGEICRFLRPKAAGSFTDHEVAALDRVLPDLRRAWGNHKAFEALEAKNEAMLSFLDRLPIGVVFVGSGCRVHERNERAEEIISGNDGVRIERGVLRAWSPPETERLHQLVALALDSKQWVHYAGADVVALSRPSGLPAISALVSPLKASEHVSGELLAVVFLSEPYREKDIDPVRLQRLYELTRAEARIASVLAQGLNLHDAAAKLGVSVNTVRTHLKKAFEKTGTDRQADLVRIILSGVPSIRATHDRENGLGS